MYMPEKGLFGITRPNIVEQYPKGVYIPLVDAIYQQFGGNEKVLHDPKELIALMHPMIDLLSKLDNSAVRGSLLSTLMTQMSGLKNKETWLRQSISAMEGTPTSTTENLSFASKLKKLFVNNQSDEISRFESHRHISSQVGLPDIDIRIGIQSPQVLLNNLKTHVAQRAYSFYQADINRPEPLDWGFDAHDEEWGTQYSFTPLIAQSSLESLLKNRHTPRQIYVYPYENPGLTTRWANPYSNRRDCQIVISFGRWNDGVFNFEYRVIGKHGDIPGTVDRTLASLSVSPDTDSHDFETRRRDIRGVYVNSWDQINAPIVSKLPDNSSMIIPVINGGLDGNNRFIAKGIGAGSLQPAYLRKGPIWFEWFRHIYFGPAVKEADINSGFIYLSPENLDRLSQPIQFSPELYKADANTQLEEFMRVMRKAIIYGDLSDNENTNLAINIIASPSFVAERRDLYLEAKDDHALNGWIRRSRADLLVSLFYGPREVANLARKANLKAFFPQLRFLEEVEMDLIDLPTRIKERESFSFNPKSPIMNGWLDLVQVLRTRFLEFRDCPNDIDIIIKLIETE